MRIIFSILLIILSACSKGQNRIDIVIGNSGAPISLTEVVYDPNDAAPLEYNGVPYSGTTSDGYVISMWKKSNTHASSGPLMFAIRTTSGWQASQVVVGADSLDCAALIMSVLSSGRILCVYQDNDGTIPSAYQEFKIVFSDDKGVTWSYGATYSINDGGTHANSVYGRILELPSGKILIPYYRYPLSGGSSYAGILESVNEGISVTLGANVLVQTGGTYPNGYTSEIGWCITHNTGSDATTKIAALLRNEQYGYYTHVRSPDGGTTWERIAGETGGFANDMFYQYGSDIIQKSPVDISLHSGTISIINGVRRLLLGNMYGSLELITCTPDDFYNNVKANYSEIDQLWVALANESMAETDFGYPTITIDNFGKRATQFYDASPHYTGFPADKRCMIYQIRID